jgi:hypothetical protein
VRGVHRITVHRWFKQYSAGGLQEMLKIWQATGRALLNPLSRNIAILNHYQDYDPIICNT